MLRVFVLTVVFMLVMAQQPHYCNYQGMADVQIGDRVYVCLHLPNGRRVAFPVAVDEYTAMKPTGVYGALVTSSTPQTSNIFIQFQDKKIQSGYLYADGATQQVADVYSFVIRLDKGKVLSVESDNENTCKQGCANGVCRSVANDQNCYRKASDAQADNQPKIYLSWMGTDRNGAYMLSQTKRISRFTEYSVGKVYQDALKIFK